MTACPNTDTTPLPEMFTTDCWLRDLEAERREPDSPQDQKSSDYHTHEQSEQHQAEPRDRKQGAADRDTKHTTQRHDQRPDQRRAHHTL
jgi:hypothetical protein